MGNTPSPMTLGYGMPSGLPSTPTSTPTFIYVGTAGTCSGVPAPNMDPTNCQGQWSPFSGTTCTINKLSITSDQCKGLSGNWAVASPTPAPPPAPTPAPTANPCACKTGAACPSTGLCGSCIVNGVCSSIYPTSAECTSFVNGAKWCGK
ncbi:hypothetical protein THRCLA_10826 [Thraustotheca clavata]|uniref:Uncharacterized protein n=1 Tax=Thraustotheca clavata TaxID=74557 RepID=A0A1V9YFC6_9STRA|nr:hypothetical protein THRCLA_10826 [Thraustotheca clavata]